MLKIILMKTQLLSVEKVKEIFERMTDEDVNIIGFSDTWCRPEWMICSVFADSTILLDRIQ